VDTHFIGIKHLTKKDSFTSGKTNSVFSHTNVLFVHSEVMHLGQAFKHFNDNCRVWRQQ